MLIKEAKERMTFEEFFSHEWLQTNQPCNLLTDLRDTMLEKEMGRSNKSKHGKMDLMANLKYLDKILVYKFFLTVKEQNENIIFSNVSLAKRLMALGDEESSPLVKSLQFTGLLILMKNIKETQEVSRTLWLNNTSIQIPSYNLIREVKAHEDSQFSQSLPVLSRKTVISAHSMIRSLSQLPQN